MVGHMVKHCGVAIYRWGVVIVSLVRVLGGFEASRNCLVESSLTVQHSDFHNIANKAVVYKLHAGWLINYTPGQL